MPANRVTRLRNVNCAYCGCELSTAPHVDEDHVIARRFVPKGTMQGAWNLIVNVCRPCNAAKAELEDDISAITMHPDVLGRFACDDERLRQEAARKTAKSMSRKTGKPVAESKGSMTIRGRMGPMTMTMTLVSRPQVEDARMYQLALCQLRAFFFYQTYKEDTRRGHFWLGGFYPLALAHKEDWGRERIAWFMRSTADWDLRWHSVTADGFHKAITRKHPKHDLWAWALEWNQAFRIVGFFGDERGMVEVQADLPDEPTNVMGDQKTGQLKMRFEVPLAPENDTLFPTFDDEEQAPEGIQNSES